MAAGATAFRGTRHITRKLGIASNLSVQPRVLVQHHRKHVQVQGTLPDPHPAVMVTECNRRRTARRQTLGPPAGASDSPHSLGAKCTILPIHRHDDPPLRHDSEPRAKGRRKRSYERPPPAYWQPGSNQRGKCLGYALGYPGSWSARYEGDPRKRWYVRDVMRKGTFYLTCKPK